MKLTKSKLRQIIKEELDFMSENGDDWYSDEYETRADRKYADRSVESFDPATEIEKIEATTARKFGNPADVAYLMTSKTKEEFNKRVEEMWEPPEEDYGYLVGR